MNALLNLSLLAWVPSSIGEWAIAIVIVAAMVALVYVALKQFGIAIPQWVQTVFWILVAAVVIVGAIRFLMSI